MDDDMEQPCPPQFPHTLQEFGYHFKNGELRHIETGEKFQFVVKENDHHYNQLHYEALGKVIEDCIYELLENECGLHRLPVPADLQAGWSHEPANQTDDAKAASTSVDREAISESAGLDIATPQDHISADPEKTSAQSDGSEKMTDMTESSTRSPDKSEVEKSGDEAAIKSSFSDTEGVQAGAAVSPAAAMEHTERSGFVFASEGWSKQEKLMVLIHGSGVVRAGQWARRLIINDNLNTGTQMPFIKEAVKLGYGIIVMNTNQNFVVDKHGFSRSIPGSESPVAHASHVWQHYIVPSAATSVAVVAHSYGGVVVTHLFEEYREHFQEKVFAVAFTDSVHSSPLPRSFGYFMKICRNWVTSSEPLDTPLRSRTSRDVPLVSAGVNSHEMTSSASMMSIFKFFEEMLLRRSSMDVDEPAEQSAVSNEEPNQVSDDRNLSDEDKHEGPRATSVNERNNPPDDAGSEVEESVAVSAEDGASVQDTA